MNNKDISKLHLESCIINFDELSIFPPNYEITNLDCVDNVYYFKLRSKNKDSICPICKVKTDNYDNLRQKILWDVPIGQKATILILSYYSFICKNPDCSNHIFVDKTDQLFNEYSERTKRLDDYIAYISCHLTIEETIVFFKKLGYSFSESLIRKIHNTIKITNKKIKENLIDEDYFLSKLDAQKMLKLFDKLQHN